MANIVLYDPNAVVTNQVTSYLESVNTPDYGSEPNKVVSPDLFQFGFISAIMFSLEAFGTSDASYGAGSAKTKFISRPDVSNIGIMWSLAPSVSVSPSDADAYLRYAEHAKLLLDFSSSAQTSSVTKF